MNFPQNHSICRVQLAKSCLRGAELQDEEHNKNESLRKVVALLCQISQSKKDTNQNYEINKNSLLDKEEILKQKNKKTSTVCEFRTYSLHQSQRKDEKLITLLYVLKNEIETNFNLGTLDSNTTTNQRRDHYSQQVLGNQNLLLEQIKKMPKKCSLNYAQLLFEKFTKETNNLEKSRQMWLKAIRKNSKSNLFQDKESMINLENHVHQKFDELNQLLTNKILLEIKKIQSQTKTEQQNQKKQIITLRSKKSQANLMKPTNKKCPTKICRKRLPNSSKLALKQWIEKKVYTTNGPFATYQEKKILCKKTGLALKQVSSYLGNYRRKLKNKIRKGEIPIPDWY
ncbi:homeobox protein mohawk [Anaeramoeba flamelloides]|uniref:Homeobox protein mohawk n=1 Tax=Anaeramoeba flamelloides TaxID=1746091 RepID=A0ABQ8Y4J8_9EUKA|nr:homeobox protein mohawk [Anaeramoeba flamelloides]